MDPQFLFSVWRMSAAILSATKIGSLEEEEKEEDYVFTVSIAVQPRSDVFYSLTSRVFYLHLLLHFSGYS